MGLVLIGDMGRWGLEMGKREDGGWCIWGVGESEAVQHGCGLRMLCEEIGCGCGCGRGEGGGLEGGVLGLGGWVGELGF